MDALERAMVAVVRGDHRFPLPHGIRFSEQLHQDPLNQRNNANTETRVDIGFPHGRSDTLAEGNFHY